MPKPLTELAVQLKAEDNVAVAVRHLDPGTEVQVNGHAVQLAGRVMFGHKFALEPIEEGAPVRKYGQIIGFASQRIETGDHVHTHNVSCDAYERDYAFSTAVPDPPIADEERFFDGFLRDDGKVGTRNYIPPSKQFFVFERIFPDIQRMAFVRRKGEPNSTNQYEEFKTMLSARGISLVDIAAVDLAEIREELTAAIHGVDVIYSACDTLTHAGGEEIIIELSLAYGKPAFACNKEGILKGALAGNIGDFHKIGNISGEKAYHILRGSQPSWLETESPRDDYIIVNTDTAKRLGISIPVDVMKEAQEIVGNGTS